jgi:nicotinamidase-related amidase
MKSCYFTHETIGHKSQEMLQELEKCVRIREIDFVPEQSALLILDMQRYFLDERSHAYVPSAVPIMPRIKKLAHAFDAMNRPIILTRHLNTNQDAKLMARWWRDLITENDDWSEIVPELQLPHGLVVSKTQYDGFYQTGLEDTLKAQGVTQLVITGVISHLCCETTARSAMSHLCCETTARSAFVRGFTVWFPIDGTATYNQDFHWATVLNLSHGFVIPALTPELQHYLEASTSAG